MSDLTGTRLAISITDAAKLIKSGLWWSGFWIFFGLVLMK